ncbi:hypothetical protein FL966_00810 [Caproiciproducens galactitolivorans]|nr:hypothetical protein FL966_00810 [Caproiciproducens galactitolivorans]
MDKLKPCDIDRLENFLNGIALARFNPDEVIARINRLKDMLTDLCNSAPENKPLTLERLRQMDGEPVWIKGSDAKTSGWALIKGKREKQIANCPDDWNISYYMKDYGKTWLAYSRKLENKPLTNGDLIRSMSNEKLAVTLTCPNEMGMDEIDCDHSDDKNCCQCLLDWLNQPYEPEQEATL